MFDVIFSIMDSMLILKISLGKIKGKMYTLLVNAYTEMVLYEGTQ